MQEAAVTPETALRELARLSDEVLGCALLDRAGATVAVSVEDAERAGRFGALARELLERADRAIAPAGPASELEVSTAGGSVFALRERDWTLVALTRRSALPALVLHDMRRTLAPLVQVVP